MYYLTVMQRHLQSATVLFGVLFGVWGSIGFRKDFFFVGVVSIWRKYYPKYPPDIS